VGLLRLRQPTITIRHPDRGCEPTARPAKFATNYIPHLTLTLSAPEGGEGNAGEILPSVRGQPHGAPTSRRTTLTSSNVITALPIVWPCS
jgi:hypothetical protein